MSITAAGTLGGVGRLAESVLCPSPAPLENHPTGMQAVMFARRWARAGMAGHAGCWRAATTEASSSASTLHVPGIARSGSPGSPFGVFQPNVGIPAVSKTEEREENELPDAADKLLHRYIDLGNTLIRSDDTHLDLEQLVDDARRFHVECSADPTAPDPFVAFSKHYYALPRPEMIVPAFVALMGSEDGLTGPQQLTQSLFFGRALGGLGMAAVPLGVLLAKIVDETGAVMLERAADDDGRLRAARLLAARREGILLALLHTEQEALVGLVEQAAEASRRVVDHLDSDRDAEATEASHSEREASRRLAMDAAKRMDILLPTDPSLRGPVQAMTWPLPGLPYEEPTFFASLLNREPVPWARSSDLISLVMTVAEQAGEDGRSLPPEVWARLGKAVGEVMQDALWAEFHVSGSVLALRKCMAAAAEWLPFMDEHGPEHVLDPENTPVPSRYRWLDGGEAEGDSDEARKAAATDADDGEELADPRERMRFHLARRAVSRLVREASQHPLVVEVVELERRDIMHLAHSAAEVEQSAAYAKPMLTVSASARQAAASIEAIRPILHMALAEGRTAVKQYSEMWAGRLFSGDDAQGVEPLCGDTGAIPPGGLVAMGWALPPMVGALWAGENPLPESLRDNSAISDDAVREAVSRSGQIDRTGFCIPVVPSLPREVASVSSKHEEEDDVAAVDAATSKAAVHVPWDIAAKRSGFDALTGKVSHEIFVMTRRMREAEAQAAASGGSSGTTRS